MWLIGLNVKARCCEHLAFLVYGGWSLGFNRQPEGVRRSDALWLKIKPMQKAHSRVGRCGSAGPGHGLLVSLWTGRKTNLCADAARAMEQEAPIGGMIGAGIRQI